MFYLTDIFENIVGTYQQKKIYIHEKYKEKYIFLLKILVQFYKSYLIVFL